VAGDAPNCEFALICRHARCGIWWISLRHSRPRVG